MSFTNIWVKICANTSLEDALLAADAGADAVGFVFAPSPRRVTLEQVAAIVPQLPAALEKIGVFVDASFAEIAAAVDAAGLTGVQLHFDAAPELPGRLRARFGPPLRILRVLHFEARKSEENARDADEIFTASSNPDLVSDNPGLVSGHEFRTCPEQCPPSAENAASFVTGHDFSRAANATKSIGALAPEGCFEDANVDAILVDTYSTKTAGGTGQTFDWAGASKTLFQNAKERKFIAAGGLTPANVAQAIATLRPWGVDVVSGVEAAPGRKDAAKMRDFIANARAAGRGK